MIAKQFRIPREKIPYILKKGTSLKSELFILRYLPCQSNHSRYRTIVSKKLSKNAHERNKLRRRIYEAIRTSTSPEPGPKHDIILIPQKKIQKAGFTEIKNDIQKIIQKLSR